MRGRWPTVVVLVVVLAGSIAGAPAAAGCGGSPPPAESAPSEILGSGEPVDLRIASTDGAVVATEEMRGVPVLLFFFATFDVMSQAVLDAIGQFIHDFPAVPVVGIAVEPDAEALVGPWAQAAGLPFLCGVTLGVSPSDGLPGLAAIDRVPTFVALDADGRARGRQSGFVTPDDLAALIDGL